MRYAGTREDLAPLGWLSAPIWVFDIERRCMWWANERAVSLWEARNVDELRARNFESMSTATTIRLDDYLIRLRRDEIVDEQWTFYPNGKPVTVECRCSAIRIGAAERIAMLVEGRMVAEQPPDVLRATEALRHTVIRVALFALNGDTIFQNPADIAAFGSGTRLIDRFCNATLARKVLVEALARQVSQAEVKLSVHGEPHWHSIEIRRVRDPADGETRLLVAQFDFAQLAERARKVKARAASPDDSQPPEHLTVDGE